MAFDFNKLASPEFQAMMHREAKNNPQVSGKGQAGLTESSMSTPSMAYADEGDAKFESAIQARMGQIGSTQGYLTEEQMMATQQPQQRTYAEGVDPMPFRENTDSKLPPAILATLRKNQGLHEQMSVAQGVTSGVEQLAAKMPKKTMVQETVIPTTQPSTTIDYSLIKTIVEECIDRKFKDNNLLNESSLRTIGLKNGKIRLVDNGGNIYEAKLEKKGNINDKK